MGKERKTIGVLTSGGDAPGMNAAVRAVVRMGINRGFSVVGIRRGYSGLLANDMDDMDLRSVSDILQRGGTSTPRGVRSFPSSATSKRQWKIAARPGSMRW